MKRGEVVFVLGMVAILCVGISLIYLLPEVGFRSKTSLGIASIVASVGELLWLRFSRHYFNFASLSPTE